MRLNLKATPQGVPAVISELKTAEGRSVVASNGEFNANDNKELVNVLASIAEAAGAGQHFMTTAEADTAATRTNHEILTASLNSEEEFQEMITAFAEEISITSNRDGFMRRFLARQELTVGEPRIEVDYKDTVAAVATGPTKTQTQLVTNRILRPDEFYIKSRSMVEHKDIAQASGDILSSKYIAALEAIMVQEDRIFRSLLESTDGIDNNSALYAGLTPAQLAEQLSTITAWGLDPRNWLIASDVMQHIITNPGFVNQLNATSYAEEALSGNLGSLFGLNIVTDSFRHPTHKVLDAGDSYVLTAPETLGRYTDRDGLNVKSIDDSHESTPASGWSIYELMSMSVVSTRGVSIARVS